MSLINSGFDGTVTERDFSRIMRGAGVRDSVETVAAWAVTQGTGRQVSVAPGVAYAAGVVSDSGVAILAALPTPTNGQWHLVVRRINWASNTVTVATIPHTTTTTTIPTAPPAGFPVFNDNTGVLVDQHLAWAWVRSTDTAVAVFDLRGQPLLRTIGVDLPVANFAALPATGNFVGRQITTIDAGVTFRWNGSAWVAMDGAQPFCLLRRSANYTLTAAPVALTWNVETRDDFAMHSNTVNPSRIIATTAGVYDFVCTVFNSNADGFGTMFARINGSTSVVGSTDRRGSTGGVSFSMSTSFSPVLAVNDYVEILIEHSTATGTIEGGTGSGGASLTAKRIGA